MTKNQPTTAQEQELMAVNDDRTSVVSIPGRNSVMVGFMKPYATERFTKLMLDSNVKVESGSEIEALNIIKEKSTIPHRLASIALLNKMWKIKLFYWIKWRWMAYVQEWTFDQCFPVILEGKKKIPSESYAWCIMLGVAMMETTMTMTKKEVEQYRQELLLVQDQHSQKNIPGQ